MRLNKENKIISFLYLIRLNNILISLISIIVALYITGNNVSIFSLIIALTSIVFLTSGGNIINDFFDIETDRINKPLRPLVMHNYNLKFIYVLSIVFLLIGIFLPLLLSVKAFIISLIAGVFLYFYSKNFKRLPIIGNLVISILSGLLFLYGAIIGNNIQSGIFPAIFAFFITFGREITKDIEDMEGDEIAGMKTLPIIIGKDRAFIIAIINYSILIVLTFIPYLMEVYNKWYFFIIIFGVDTVLLFLMIMFYLFDDIKTKRFVNNYIKYDMIIGLIAIIMGVKR